MQWVTQGHLPWFAIAGGAMAPRLLGTQYLASWLHWRSFDEATSNRVWCRYSVGVCMDTHDHVYARGGYALLPVTVHCDDDGKAHVSQSNNPLRTCDNISLVDFSLNVANNFELPSARPLNRSPNFPEVVAPNDGEVGVPSSEKAVRAWGGVVAVVCAAALMLSTNEDICESVVRVAC